MLFFHWNEFIQASSRHLLSPCDVCKFLEQRRYSRNIYRQIKFGNQKSNNNIGSPYAALTCANAILMAFYTSLDPYNNSVICILTDEETEGQRGEQFECRAQLGLEARESGSRTRTPRYLCCILLPEATGSQHCPASRAIQCDHWVLSDGIWAKVMCTMARTGW